MWKAALMRCMKHQKLVDVKEETAEIDIAFLVFLLTVPKAVCSCGWGGHRHQQRLHCYYHMSMFATSRFIFLVFMLSELVLRTVRNWKDPLGLLAFDSPRGFCSWPPSCFSLCFEYSVFRNSKVNHVNGWNSSQNVCARREVPSNNWIYPQSFRISSLDVLEMQKCVWFLIWGLVTH